MRTLKRILFTIFLLLLLVTHRQAMLQAESGFEDRLGMLQQTFLSFGVPYNSYNIQNTDLNSMASEAVDKVTPAVVSIYGTAEVPAGENAGNSGSQNSFLGAFGSILPGLKDYVPVTKVSAGTGFLVDSRGYILTNNHVIAEDNAKISVVLQDGKKKTASVVYKDPSQDLAILKISGSNYPTLSLGDSSNLKIGEPVLGLGNAFGRFENTISAGKVTSLKRTIIAGNEDTQQKLSGVIQTSAQLYPGDSGGPLFELDGTVVGINVAVSTDRDNVSFSIPINKAKSVIEQYVK